ncbi:hypothetical protein BJY04DRAFT_216451 [Aspergillus karnatakaensis]|uniref:uncharacterized protein n=1 Tax=Aspergillus karnatakaensis TaxID=1810916 RepID=UPI003CCDFA38
MAFTAINAQGPTREPSADDGDVAQPAHATNSQVHSTLFAGEILSVRSTDHYHTELTVKDISDTVVRIGFCCQIRTTLSELLCRETTTLVLWPDTCEMAGGDQGIEIHNTRYVKVIPRTLAI